jgi:phage terminase small subunit
MRSTPEGDPYLDFSSLTRDQTAALAEVTVEDFVDGRGKGARAVKRRAGDERQRRASESRWTRMRRIKTVRYRGGYEAGGG